MNLKRIQAALMALILTVSLAACAQQPLQSGPESSEPESSLETESLPGEEEEEIELLGRPIKVAALKGPTAIGMVKLMDDAAQGVSENGYEFTLAGSPDEIVGSIVQGEFDIAAVPTNLAATLYNKTQGKVQLAALNTMGILYVVETGETVQSVEDLRGRTIYSTGKGSVPEFALNYILEKNGLTDVTVEYKSEHSELAAMMAAGQCDLAVLPQPFVTSVLAQNEDVRVALDLTEEWDKAAGGESGLTMGCIVIQKDFIEQYPDVVESFLAEYQSSVDYVTDSANLEQAAQLVVAQGIIASAPIAVKAIPECSIVLKTGGEMKAIASGFLKVLYDANPQSVGGTLPDEGLYYIAG